MFKKSQLPLPIVKSKCVTTIGRSIGKKWWLFTITKAANARGLKELTTNVFSGWNMEEHATVPSIVKSTLWGLVRSDWSTDHNKLIKFCRKARIQVKQLIIVSQFKSTKQCFHFRSMFLHQRYEISIFLPNTIDDADHERQSAEGERTRWLIGFANVLPMFGSPTVIIV